MKFSNETQVILDLEKEVKSQINKQLDFIQNFLEEAKDYKDLKSRLRLSIEQLCNGIGKTNNSEFDNEHSRLKTILYVEEISHLGWLFKRIDLDENIILEQE